MKITKSSANSLYQTYIEVVSFFTFLLVLLAACIQPAYAYQIPANAANTWTVTGATASKSTPSGVRVNAAITGAPIVFAALNNISFMAGLGAAGTPVGTFLTPALPLTTNGLQIQANLAAPCQASNPNDLSCNTFGTVTYTFTDAGGLPIAVRNPVMHVSRVGGFTQAGGNTLYMGVTHTLTSAGATLGAFSAGSVGLNVAGTIISPALTTTSVWNGTCPAAATTVTAGCGSIPITGTISTLAFNIGALRHNNIATTPWNTNASAGADAWYVTFSFDEDFGDAPASYQGDSSAAGTVGTAPASHIQSDLTLGAAWTTANNNTTVLNGTSAAAAPFQVSPVQVAAGADNNSASGDGAEENGLTSPLPAITTNQIGGTYTLTPTLSGVSRAGQVCGWIDFNGDGAFTAAEGSCTAIAAGAASAALNWTIPTATTAGRAYVRIRASYAALTTASFNGLVNSGEVEDYNMDIKPAVRVVKAVSPAADPGTFNLSIAGSNFATAVGNGGTTGFRSVYQATTTANDVTVATSVATAAVTGVVLTETAAGVTVLTDYATTSICTNAAGTAVAVGGTALAPSITIPQSVTGAAANGQAQTITCTLTNTRKSASLSITKTDGKDITISGDVNNYVVTLTNQGPFAADGAVLTDVASAGLTCPAANPVTCTVTSGAAACPAGPLSFANLITGITLLTFPANSALQFAYTCSVN